MSHRASQARLLFSMAFLSLRSHHIKNGIVGALLAAGALLWVVGTSLYQSVEGEMKKTLTDSLVGDLQAYAADAPDPLALVGGFGMGAEDVGEIADFDRVVDALADVSAVKAVLPMGLVIASTTTQSLLDQALAELRVAVGGTRVPPDADQATRVPDAELQGRIAAVRDALSLLAEDLEAARAWTYARDVTVQERADLREARRDGFWRSFSGDPLASLDWLDTRIAPLAGEGQLAYLRVLGTDLSAFRTHFSRFRWLRGTFPAPGTRGLLLNRGFMEDHLKLPALRQLDALASDVDEGQRRIADDPALQQRVAQVQRQVGNLTAAIRPEDRLLVQQALEKEVGPGRTLSAQLARLLALDDENFTARVRFFRTQVEPHLRRYLIDVGDEVPLTSFTQAGYPRAVAVPVAGIFTFAGLEESDLAGATNLVDMATFRELYGQPTAENLRELAALKQEAGIRVIPRGRVEEELYGPSAGPARSVAPAPSPAAPSPAAPSPAAPSPTAPSTLAAAPPDAHAPDAPPQATGPLARSAAILLQADADPEQASAAIRDAFARHQLRLQVISWREASGLVGQFVTVVQVVLYVALGILFLVAGIIIHNSMVLSTMERVREIGTLRALGAPRGFVRALLLLETLVLAWIATLVGSALGVAVIALLHVTGIPATHAVWIFLFGGPELFPDWQASTLGGAFLLIGAISQLAALYPARLATTVPPIIAMQRAE